MALNEVLDDREIKFVMEFLRIEVDRLSNGLPRQSKGSPLNSFVLDTRRHRRCLKGFLRKLESHWGDAKPTDEEVFLFSGLLMRRYDGADNQPRLDSLIRRLNWQLSIPPERMQERLRWKLARVCDLFDAIKEISYKNDEPKDSD